jgi:hypothetical protein
LDFVKSFLVGFILRKAKAKILRSFDLSAALRRLWKRRKKLVTASSLGAKTYHEIKTD